MLQKMCPDLHVGYTFQSLKCVFILICASVFRILFYYIFAFICFHIFCEVFLYKLKRCFSCEMVLLCCNVDFCQFTAIWLRRYGTLTLTSWCLCRKGTKLRIYAFCFTLFHVSSCQTLWNWHHNAVINI